MQLIDNDNFQDMTQDEYINYVLIQGENGTGNKKITDYTWSLAHLTVDDLLLNQEHPISKEEWIIWLEEEKQERIIEQGNNSISSITDYWLPYPEKEPIILYKTDAGEYGFSDGYHRFAIAIKNGLLRVPVILGVSYSNQ